MPTGMSTRAVGAPIGTSGAFAPSQRVMRVVPLSAFFLDAEDDEVDDDALVGFRDKKKPSGEKRPERVNKDRGKDKNNSKGPDTTGGSAGGDAAAADAAVAGKRQSTAGGAERQESVTMSTGTALLAPGGSTRSASFPGGPSKLGATHGSTGGVTGSGNVAQYPVPIGRRRKRRKQESLSHWINRLGKMAL